MALIWSDILYIDDGSLETAGTNMIVKSIQRACAHYCQSSDPPDNVSHWKAGTKKGPESANRRFV